MRKINILLILAFACYSHMLQANKNIFKHKPVSCSGVPYIGLVNDGNYSSHAQFPGGGRLIYINLDGNTVFNKSTHCYIYFDGDLSKLGLVKIWGRSGSGSWNLLGQQTVFQDELLDIPCNGNYYLSEIKVYVYSSVSYKIKEIIYVSEPESVAGLSISPSMGADIDRVRDGQNQPYCEFNDAKHTIIYNFYEPYKSVCLKILFKHRDYSAGNIKVSYYSYEKSAWYILNDVTLFRDEVFYSNIIPPGYSSNKIKIEMENSYNYENKISIKEIEISGCPANFTVDYSHVFYSEPSYDRRAVAEWEESEGIAVFWRSIFSGASDGNPHKNYTKQLISELNDKGKVYVICHDIKNFKEFMGSELQSLDKTEIVYTDSEFGNIFARDRLPVPLFKETVDQSIGATVNCSNNSPVAASSYLDNPLFWACDIDIPELSKHFDGGNFMTDGHNTAIVNLYPYGASEEEIQEMITELKQNIEYIFSCENQIVINNIADEGIHIDYSAKLINEETILVKANKTDSVESALENEVTCYGRDFNIVTLPSAPVDYTNSLIFNGSVYVPVMDPLTDNCLTALSVYEDEMPGYNIVPIASSASCTPDGGGLVHCMTMNVASEDPVFISHAPLMYSGPNKNYSLTAEVHTPSGVSKCEVCYKQSGAYSFTCKQMNQVHNNAYGTTIYLSGSGPLKYYIRATANNGKVRTKPYPGADGPYILSSSSLKSAKNDGISVQHAESTEIKLFPNPAVDIINIRTNNVNESTVKIFDIYGRLVFEQTFICAAEIDVSGIPGGLYIIEIVPANTNSLKNIYKVSIE